MQTTTLAPTTAAPTTSAPIESADPNDRLISDSEWKVIVELSAADAEASVERAVPFIGGFCDFVGQLGLQETKRRFESTFDENDVPQVGRDLTYNGATYYCLDVLTANP